MVPVHVDGSSKDGFADSLTGIAPLIPQALSSGSLRITFVIFFIFMLEYS